MPSSRDYDYDDRIICCANRPLSLSSFRRFSSRACATHFPAVSRQLFSASSRDQCGVDVTLRVCEWMRDKRRKTTRAINTELGTDIQRMAVARHALPRGQKVKGQGHAVIRCAIVFFFD